MKLEMNCPRCGKLMRVECNSKTEFTLTCENCTQEIKDKKTDCYIGIKPCGCIVAWASDALGPKVLSECVKDYIQSGYKVERANTDDVINAVGECMCGKPSTKKGGAK